MVSLLSHSPSLSCSVEEDEDGFFVDVPAFLKGTMEKSSEYNDLFQLLTNRTHSIELRQNGLGYNNLIYMSTILGDMSIEKEGIYQNLLLVEEPEAHLHPQLQELINEYFISQHRRNGQIQIVFTSHSPTLVSKMELNQINLLYEQCHHIQCMPMATCKAAAEMDSKRHLHKYLDVTKSQLFFAKGLLFVEGISEALLLPAIANSINRPLERYAVEVINVGGLAFKPFAHLLSRNDGMPAFCRASIITDDDRCTEKGDNYIDYELDYDSDITGIAEKLQNGHESERFTNLRSICDEACIHLSGAIKTLEYELTFCEKNINAIVAILKQLFKELGKKLEERVMQCSTLEEKRVVIWLFIRRRAKYKAEIAEAVSNLVTIKEDDGSACFLVPEYLKDAIYYVTEQPHAGEKT